jgi:hypothetical protein
MRTVCLRDPATGKELRKIECPQGVHSLAFSPDGRLLATGEHPHVRLWDVRTGQEVRRWEGHRDLVAALAFAPDGRTLASGSHDAMILVWDVTGLLEKGRLPRTALARPELERLWGDLAAEDAVRAHGAVWRLAAAPGDAVPFLGEHLRPPAALDPRRSARLLADLDSDQFKTREDASLELERLGERAEPLLRKALQNEPSAEVRRRVEVLLEKLEMPERAAEQLRLLRGVQSLECSGTPAARELLQALARGAPEAGLTQEAKAARERLDSRDRRSAGGTDWIKRRVRDE